MKFFLTIYVCSVVSQTCALVPPEKHDYKRLYKTHYGCVQKGLGESYAIIFDGEVFGANVVESLELYPKFHCTKVENYQENAPLDTTPPVEKDL
jgi:hypothetical protein|tara:strand:+ start:2249 stop:2530 length:282 start_codon:yes stop_codon:yes gene_type:complete